MADTDTLFSTRGTLGEFLANLPWPVKFFDAEDLPAFMNSVWVLDAAVGTAAFAEYARLWLVFPDEVVLSVPGLDGVQLVIGGELGSGPAGEPPPNPPQPPPPANDDDEDEVPPDELPPDDLTFDDDIEDEPELPELHGLSFLCAELFLGTQPRLRFSNITIALRFAPEILKPANPQDGPVEILARGSVVIDHTFDVHVEGFDSLTLKPAIVGDSGVVISADGVQIDLSRTSSSQSVLDAGFDDSFLGVFIGQATMTLPAGMLGPDAETVVLSNAAIGSGGVSGTATLPREEPNFLPAERRYQGTRAGSMLGIPFWLTEFHLTVKANAFLEAAITGEMFLPFFEKRVIVSVSFDGNGGFIISVSGVVGGAPGLIVLDVASGIRFEVLSLAIEDVSGKALLRLNTRLELQSTIGGFNWPKPEINGLTIDSDGNVRVEGGWIDLPKQAVLDLHAAKLEITKVGFGKEDNGDRWIGFSGGVKIVDGLKAGASVKGLRIRWSDPLSLPSVSLEGVGVELEIPKALSITGSVSLEGTEFRGAVKVVVIPASLTIEGQFVTGEQNGTRFFAIYLRGELPAGIPLGATGLAFYGFSGLYAHHMSPNKGATDDWYENPDDSPGWYLKSPKGVAQLDKWKGDPGHFAFGAGITLGTFADNGYEFSGRLLLVLTFPGPTILIDGRANLFKKRSELEGDDPTFRAFAVIEPEKSFLLNMTAHYKYKGDGQLMDIRGGAEAYFNFRDADDWHIYIGQKDRPERRIGCTVFKLFDVQGYFQLTPHQLDVGASWEFNKSWGFKRLNVHLASKFATDATVSWHPNHFTGSARFSGTAEARAFGRGVGVSVNTTISGDVFEPFHLQGKFWAGINLPWPLPDLGASITLKWEEDLIDPPVLPLPLREATVEHNKRMLKWPMPRATENGPPPALFPNNNGGKELEFRATDPIGAADPPQQAVPEGAPDVPADSRLGLNFSRPIRDPGHIGINPTEVSPELIGDPAARKAAYTVGFKLVSVGLEKRIPAPLAISDPSPRWVEIARVQGTYNDDRVLRLSGSWTPVPPTESSPDSNSEQLKLLINAKTPFEYSAQTQQVLDAWFEDRGSDYPCQPPAVVDPEQPFCNSFVGVAYLPPEGNTLELANPGFRISWSNDVALVDSEETVPGSTSHRSLAAVATTGSNEVFIQPLQHLDEVKVRVGTVQGLPNLLPTLVGNFVPQGNTLTMDNVVLSVFAASDPDAVLTPGPGPGKTPAAAFLDANGNLSANDLTEITLRAPATSALNIDVRFIIGFDVDTQNGFVDYNVFSESGEREVTRITTTGPQSFRSTIPAGRIARIAIFSSGGYFSSISRVHARLPVQATAVSADGATIFGPYEEVDGVIDVQGEDLGVIKVGTQHPSEFTILELCTADRHLELIRRTFTALDQLTREDEMFDPQANYRLVVTTLRTDKSAGDGSADDDAAVIDNEPRFVEQAYFNVVGPPGLGVPESPAGAEPGPTGFEDLRFYVKDTVPAIKFDDDNKPIVPRAFYRAYDVAFGFNEPSAVEKMYRLARRDLTLRVFDAANNPVRDAGGHIVIPGVRWERESSPTLTEATSRWVRMVNAAQCRPSDIPVFDQSTILGDQKISGQAEVVLAPQSLYQARLVPALLHESFINPIPGLVADGTHELERWFVAEWNGLNPSRWEIGSELLFTPDGQPVMGGDGKQAKTFFVTEKTGVRSALVYRGPIAAPVDANRPAEWTDFRASVQFRWSAGGVSFQFRRTSTGNQINVALSRGGDSALFVTSVINGTQHSLHAHPVDFGSPLSDFVLTVECVADRLRVSHAGAPPVDLVLPAGSSAKGTIGLRTDAPAGCRFTEIRVDDLRPEPAAAHRLDFITSKFTNFAHHLGSFDDRVLDPPAGLGIGVGDLTQLVIDHSVPMPSGAATGSEPIDDDERRDFDDLEKKIIGESGVLRAPERIEVIRASASSNVFAFLLRSPEPLMWERTVLTPSFASPENPEELGIPGAVKLTGVIFGAVPAEEKVTLLAREGIQLGGFVVQWRPLPDAATPEPAWAFYYGFSDADSVADGTQVLLFAGTADEAPVREPGTTHRFLAATSAEATLHFVAPGVELRLLNPAGEVVHQRQFRTPDLFTNLELRAVRKLDGTGLVLFLPPSATPPALAVMRLTFVLTRNVGNALPVLRQAGSETPEVVTLDLPLD